MAVIDLTGGRFDGRKPATGAGSKESLSPSASTALTPAAGARYAIVSPRTQAINVTVSGQTPTTAAGGVGFMVNAGDVLLLGPSHLSTLKMIQQAASAVVDVEYFL